MRTINMCLFIYTFYISKFLMISYSAESFYRCSIMVEQKKFYL